MMSRHLLKPLCAVCKKKVDRIEFVNNIQCNSVFATVYCHGSNQTCEVPSTALSDGSLSSGIAFNDQAKELNHVQHVRIAKQ
jgi:hypothetical protein